jgi:hypothetical protein
MDSESVDRSAEGLAHARDALVRRTRGAMAAAAAAAIALAGLLSAVAAQAFKGHQADAAQPAARPAESQHVHVPAPQRIPAIAGQPPLQPPQQPPAAATPDPAAAAPVPQVSGGS